MSIAPATRYTYCQISVRPHFCPRKPSPGPSARLSPNRARARSGAAKMYSTGAPAEYFRLPTDFPGMRACHTGWAKPPPGPEERVAIPGVRSKSFDSGESGPPSADATPDSCVGRGRAICIHGRGFDRRFMRVGVRLPVQVLLRSPATIVFDSIIRKPDHVRRQPSAIASFSGPVEAATRQAVECALSTNAAWGCKSLKELETADRGRWEGRTFPNEPKGLHNPCCTTTPVH